MKKYLSLLLAACVAFSAVDADAALKAVASNPGLQNLTLPVPRAIGGTGNATGDLSALNATAIQGNLSRTLAAYFSDVINLNNYTPQCDGITLSDVTTTAASNVVSSTSHTFTSADNGKHISINSGAAVSTTATPTSGSITLTSVGALTGVKIGMVATGVGIPAGATVYALPTTTTIQLSAAATSSPGSETVNFYPMESFTIIDNAGTLSGNATSSVTGTIAVFGTDVSNAMQTAIAAATTIGRGLVSLPRGICVLSNYVNMADRVSLQGQGMGQSVLYWSSTTDLLHPMLRGYTGGGCSTVTAETYRDIQLRDFSINEMSATQSVFTTDGKGIALPCTLRSLIENVEVIGSPATSIATDFGIPTTIHNIICRQSGRLASGSQGGGSCIGEGTDGLTGEAYDISDVKCFEPGRSCILMETQDSVTNIASIVINNVIAQRLSANSPDKNSAAIWLSGEIGEIVGNVHIESQAADTKWDGIRIDSGSYSGPVPSVEADIHDVFTSLVEHGVVVDYTTLPSGSLPAKINLHDLHIKSSNLAGILLTANASAAMDMVQLSNIQSTLNGTCGLQLSGAGGFTNLMITGGNYSNNGVSGSGSPLQSGLCFNAPVTNLTMTGVTATDNVSGKQKYAFDVNTAMTVTGLIAANNFTGNATSAANILGTLTAYVAPDNNGLGAVQSTLNGTTAGTVVSSQPVQTASYKVFQANTSGYENNSAVDQTITFPVSFTNTPTISVNDTGLALSVSTTTLTITAPNSTTTFTGNITVVGN